MKFEFVVRHARAWDQDHNASFCWHAAREESEEPYFYRPITSTRIWPLSWSSPFISHFTLFHQKIAFLLNFSINPKELELPIYLNMITIGAPHSGSPPVLNTVTLALLDDFLSEKDRRRTEITAVDDRTRRLRDCRSWGKQWHNKQWRETHNERPRVSFCVGNLVNSGEWGSMEL